MYFHMLCMMAQWEREWNWERTMHGLRTAQERGRSGDQPSPYSDKAIRDALKQAKTISGAAKIVGCKKITIQRRQQMWADNRNLKLEVAA
jgi:DNA invertase Pin-like site-specific DNA recombinase